MNNRNYTIDVLKAICAFLVVFIHTNYAYRGLILPITRCAVPCFFIISGYLLYREGGIGIERIKKNLSKILKITIWASIVFLIWEEVLYYFTHHECNIPTVDSITNWIIFNDYPFGFHLWYLYSFLYVLVLIIFIDRKNWWSLLFKLIPLFLVMVLVLGTYSSILFNVHIPYIYVRNFLFFGLPYFGLGAFLKKYEIRILKSTLSSKPMILGGAFLFLILCYLERFFYVNMTKDPTPDHYFSTTFLSVYFVLLALTTKTGQSWMSNIGERDSLYIYIFHPIVGTIVYKSMLVFHLEVLYTWIAPILVIISTILVIRGYRMLKSKLKATM